MARHAIPKGFLGASDVSRRAKEMGIDLKPATLSLRARQGKIPFAQKDPRTGRIFIFPEERLNDVILATPKKAIMPEGSIIVSGLLKKAKQMGLPLNQMGVMGKIKQAAKRANLPGKRHVEPGPEFAGLAQDIYYKKHRYFIPAALAEKVLQEARMRKELPQLLRIGALVKLKDIALRLGLKERSLLPKKGIQKIRIGNAYYVKSEEAARFEGQYSKRQSLGEKVAGEFQKTARVQKPGSAAEPKPLPQPESPFAKKNRRAADEWLQYNACYAKLGQFRLLDELINSNIGLEPEDFKRRVIPALNRAIGKE